jgi:hypothetical protein
VRRNYVSRILNLGFQMKTSAQLPALDGLFPGKEPWLQVILKCGMVREPVWRLR